MWIIGNKEGGGGGDLIWLILKWYGFQNHKVIFDSLVPNTY